MTVFYITCALLVLNGLFSVTGQLHMLQQSSYYNSRYFRWLNNNISVVIIPCILCIAFDLLLVFAKPFALALIAIVTVVNLLLAVNKQKKAIKPLVFTARVKRMYVTLFLVFAVLAALAVCVWNSVVIFIALLSFLPFLSCVAVNIINAPIEKIGRDRYIRDAKRILNSFNGRLKVIGITGSYGKTSEKYILARILEEKYNLTFTPGSFNTPMGVVRTIREKLKPSDEIFICEMGAKNVGDIKEICDIVHPDCGIITSVGPQHLETFKSIENVLKTKFELADEIEKNNGVVYLNFDNELIKSKATGYNFKSYSCSAQSDLKVKNIKCSRYGTSFTVEYNGVSIDLNTKLLGMHNVVNIAGAVLIAIDLGVGEKEIKFAVEHLKAVEHRLEMKPFLNGSVLIDDAYNANPEGSLEAVNVLSTFEDMRKIIVTPGLVELGTEEYKANFELGKAAAEHGLEMLLVGKERSKPLCDGANSVESYDKSKMLVVGSFKEAYEYLSKAVDSNCAVLFENDLPDNYAK